MKIKFCILEKDDKTFAYIKDCLDLLEKKDKNILGLDNKIQKQEIENHLNRKGFDYRDPNDRNEETILWINQYACDFRSYLNTIKIAAGLLHFKGITSSTITFSDFESCCDAMNELKEFLISNIF